MRQLNIHNNSSKNRIADTAEYKALLEAATIKHLDDEQEKQLLKAIRNGDKNSIPRLVESWEVIILSVMKRYDLKKSILQEAFDAAKEALTRFAEWELHSEARERFFRFGVWVVQQTIFKIKAEKPDAE